MADPGIPGIGHTIAVFNDTLGFAQTFYQRFGTVFWTNVVGTKLVFVLGPDGIAEVLANRDQAFSNREGWSYLIGPFFHRGVMLMDFDEHRHHRRIMQQAFKRERLREYLEPMNASIARGLDTWRPGPGFELYPRTKQLTLDIATEVFVGSEPGTEADRLNQAFIDTVHGDKSLVRADVPGGAWHRGLQSRDGSRNTSALNSQLSAQVPGRICSAFSVAPRARTASDLMTRTSSTT